MVHSLEKGPEVSGLQSYLMYWGKARPLEVEGPQWHPVAFHLLDVAAAMKSILQARPVMRARAARLLQLDEESAVRLLVVLALLHDIGKFARFFQAKAPAYWPIELGVLDRSKLSPSTHTQDGLLLWEEYLSDRIVGELLPATFHGLLPLLMASFGHHGKPTSRSSASVNWTFGEVGLLAAETCVRDLLALVGPVSIPQELGERDLRIASWWVAGLITLADWIGSQFQYHDPLPVEEYWPVAQARAASKVAEAGLVAASPAALKSFVGLTGKENPTPLQRWASEVAIPDGPTLFLLEDVTGAGKTEAAQVLVHRLLAAGRASGAYWGMPTQATANAMFGRQGKAISTLFADDSQPSLTLAHSQAWLQGAFRELALEPKMAQQELSYGNNDDELTATAACAAFLAADRRASLLADVGAGTVDQAFLAVHPSKFSSVRLVGLADKVLVLDEVHAYDAYMGVEATTLLQFHAALGGHAIVLSATLRHEDRSKLALAWRRAFDPEWGRPQGLLGPAVSSLVSSEAYPLATVITADVVVEDPVKATEAASGRSVRIRLVREPTSAVKEVLAAQASGGAVAWIRNTVDDCLAAARMLREAGIEPLVFHARFAQGDRQVREREVMRCFGPDASQVLRAGRVIVATQVIEQSLDLDFDFLVSDLAPMDLLIQRAGRLWRHPRRNADRPPGMECEMVVVSPDPVDEPTNQWISGDFRGTGAVYLRHGVLWQTARLLLHHGEIRSSGVVRELIESAYRDIPDGLADRDWKALSEANADMSTALFAVLKLEDGYGGSLRSWETDLQVMTRIGKKQTVLRLARLNDHGAVVPWFDNQDVRKAWALSEVRVSAWRVPARSEDPPEAMQAMRKARAMWGEFEQDLPGVVLVNDGSDRWKGGLIVDRRRVEISYLLCEGLAFKGGGHAE